MVSKYFAALAENRGNDEIINSWMEDSFRTEDVKRWNGFVIYGQVSCLISLVGLIALMIRMLSLMNDE